MVADSDPVVFEGASAHYQKAEAYEARYEARVEDVEYYAKAAKRAGSVLEYGAGAGRLTLPIARAGIPIAAVDVAPAMIDLLKRRLAVEPAAVRKKVSVHRADIRTFRTKRRFAMVLAGFFTVSHLYSLGDIRAFLRRAFRHLEPGGRLLFDLPMPHLDMPGYDPVAQVRVVHMETEHGADLLTHRCYFPQEIEMHLHYTGFDRIRLTADFSSRPLDDETNVIVVQARRPPASSSRDSPC